MKLIIRELVIKMINEYADDKLQAEASRLAR